MTIARTLAVIALVWLTGMELTYRRWWRTKLRHWRIFICNVPGVLRQFKRAVEEQT